MDIRANIASEINEHHVIATAKAGEAIHHAKEAGRLLLEVKAALPHGEFGKWLDQNITVSVRQAQRYIAVAEGKQVPIRALTSKYDTVSHLSGDTEDIKKWFNPKWSPKEGVGYGAVCGDAFYWVLPSSKYPGYFHVSRLHTLETPEPATTDPEWDGKSVFDETKRPVKAYAVEGALQHFGMADPLSVEWTEREVQVFPHPLGDPGGV